jgi:hypothetical protein
MAAFHSVMGVNMGVNKGVNNKYIPTKKPISKRLYRFKWA